MISLFLSFAATSVLDAQAQIVGTDFPFLVASALTGFFAAVLMTLTIMLLRIVGRVRMSIPLMLGSMVVSRASDAWQRRVGMTMHLAIGSLYGFIFGLLVENNILFGLNGLSGIYYGLLLWGIMLFAVMGMKGRLGFADKRMPLVALLGHIVYGLSFVLLLPIIFLN